MNILENYTKKIYLSENNVIYSAEKKEQKKLSELLVNEDLKEKYSSYDMLSVSLNSNDIQRLLIEFEYSLLDYLKNKRQKITKLDEVLMIKRQKTLAVEDKSSLKSIKRQILNLERRNSKSKLIEYKTNLLTAHFRALILHSIVTSSKYLTYNSPYENIEALNIFLESFLGTIDVEHLLDIYTVLDIDNVSFYTFLKSIKLSKKTLIPILILEGESIIDNSLQDIINYHIDKRNKILTCTVFTEDELLHETLDGKQLNQDNFTKILLQK